MQNPGRFTSFELSWYAQRESTSSSCHYISIQDDRYLAISDDFGLTGKSREDFADILASLPIGEIAQVIIRSFGFTNHPYNKSFRVIKVTQQDWVTQD